MYYDPVVEIADTKSPKSRRGKVRNIVSWMAAPASDRQRLIKEICFSNLFSVEKNGFMIMNKI